MLNRLVGDAGCGISKPIIVDARQGIELRIEHFKYIQFNASLYSIHPFHCWRQATGIEGQLVQPIMTFFYVHMPLCS